MKNKFPLFIVLFFTAILLSAAQQQEKRFLIKNIEINNKFQNFGTTYFGKNKIIYSSQNKNDSYLQLYLGTITKNGEITNSKKLKGANSKFHESNVVFSKNQKKVYFSRSIQGKKNTVKTSKDKNATIGIFVADVMASGQWKNAIPLPFNNENYDVGHPTLSKDGTKMYFTSNMPGTLGETDIFVITINSDGTFSDPKNMGPKVNSEHKEMFPYIDDNDVLFFSSNRPDESYGGLDVYAVKKYENGDISDRLHLEPPINSIADDFNYIFNDSAKNGYFSSNRETGKGSDDIYFFNETRPLVFDCYQEISGEVIDAQSKKPIPYAIVTLKDANGIDIEKITTEKDGKFLFNQAVCEAGYELLGQKKYYEENLKQFITSSKHEGQTLITIPLADGFIIKKRNKKMLDIDLINFDFDKSNIRPDAANQLDRVINTMERYPNMIIDMGSHSDSRGRDLYNLILSNKRAKSVIKYIVDKGISSDRISGKGYGEKILLNGCKNGAKCTEKEHELNRRSEFVITRM
ncbi:MAG: OmpA family protein [Flavobacteriaceae bacterium]|nr:OmpA family protein [Flavobacteriaceae bacterium]